MDRVEALHNATRHYCLQRIAHWRHEYAQLVGGSGDLRVDHDGQSVYTDEALAVFPRYNVLQAILSEVERFIVADFDSLEQARELLVVAGETAQNHFTSPSQAMAKAAIADERSHFIEYVRTATAKEWSLAPRLPYRRVLSTTETSQLRAAFAAIWGNWYGGLGDRADIPPVVTLHVAALDDVPNVHRAICETLVAHGITRVVELREFDDSFERDVLETELSYDLSEASWTAGNMEWMIYASHESSITFGGQWLIDAMKNLLPRVSKFIYKSWALEDYDIAG